MPLFFRELGNKSWWDKAHDEFGWLTKDEFIGDIFKSVKTTKGTLSIFEIDEDQNNLSRVVAALACKRSNLENFDYVLVPESDIQLHFDILQTPGKTADILVNELHRDIVQLTARKLLGLAIIFRDHMDAMTRLDKDEVKATILRSLHEESLREDDVSSSVKKKLFK